MTKLNPQTAGRTRAEEELREQVRQEIGNERQAQASDRRKNVLLYLIPTVFLAFYLLWGFNLYGWPF